MIPAAFSFCFVWLLRTLPLLTIIVIYRCNGGNLRPRPGSTGRCWMLELKNDDEDEEWTQNGEEFIKIDYNVR